MNVLPTISAVSVLFHVAQQPSPTTTNKLLTKERANTIHAISTPGNNDSPTPVVEQARAPAASGGDADDVQHEAMDAAARRGNPAAEIARLKEEAEAQERARIAQARAATAKTNAGDTGESKAFLSSK